MNYNQLRNSIQRIVGKTLTDKLASQIIQQTPTGYNVFNQFDICESDGEWIVNDLTFSSSKIALSWCIYTKQGGHNNAKALYDLDSKLYSKQIDIELLLNKLETSDDAMMQARLTEDINARRYLRKKLLLLCETAKYIK